MANRSGSGRRTKGALLRNKQNNYVTAKYGTKNRNKVRNSNSNLQCPAGTVWSLSKRSCVHNPQVKLQKKQRPLKSKKRGSSQNPWVEEIKPGWVAKDYLKNYILKR